MVTNTMRYLKTYKLFESKSSLKFTKQPSKKGAKTETYNVIKDGEVIGQIKWSSRMRGYAFLPEKQHDDEIKKFIKDLMNKRKKSKLLESNWYEMKDHINVLSDKIQIRLGRSAERHFGKVQNIIIMVDDQDITSEDDVPGLGKMNIVIKDNEIIVGDIFIPEKYRKQGIATIVYQKISDYFNLPIVNSKTKGFNQTIEGGHIWKKRERFEPKNLSVEEINYQFDQLIVKFVEKKEVRTNESTEESIHREMMIKKYGVEEIEECDGVIRNISDMALEVEDLGITVLVGYTPMTYVSVESTPKISVSVIANEILFAGKIADIDIFTDTLLSYVKSLGFSTGKNTFTTDRKMTRQILIQK